MIKITGANIKDKDMKNKVKFTYNETIKTAKCKCGNSWVPKRADDYKCKFCTS